MFKYLLAKGYFEMERIFTLILFFLHLNRDDVPISRYRLIHLLKKLIKGNGKGGIRTQHNDQMFVL